MSTPLIAYTPKSKRVSSAEAAAMIEGVLRHCTEMNVERHFVDTHGQNLGAFTFCRLLGFELMPRIKNIGARLRPRLTEPVPRFPTARAGNLRP